MSHTAPRVLVINPNSDASLTARIRDALQSQYRTCALTVIGMDHAPRAIVTLQDRQSVESDIATLIGREHAGGTDAFALACFDNIAVDRVRRETGAVVIDACEAGLQVTSEIAARYSIVTTYESAVPRISQLVAQHGVEQPVSIRASGLRIDQAQTSAGQARLSEFLMQVVAEDRCSAVLLGSGGFAGLAPELSRTLGVMVIDGVTAAVDWCCSQAGAARASNGDSDSTING